MANGILKYGCLSLTVQPTGSAIDSVGGSDVFAVILVLVNPVILPWKKAGTL